MKDSLFSISLEILLCSERALASERRDLGSIIDAQSRQLSCSCMPAAPTFGVERVVWSGLMERADTSSLRHADK
jgi:hypothetical protein